MIADAPARHVHCARGPRRSSMREQGEGGRIIVVGSPAGQRGNFGQTNYAAAKAGITAFARTWALELARAQITVNALIPTAWTRDDREHSGVRAAGRARRARRAAAARRAPGPRRRHARGGRAAGRVPRLGRGRRRQRAVRRARRRPARAVVLPGRRPSSSCARAAGPPSRSPRRGRSASRRPLRATASSSPSSSSTERGHRPRRDRRDRRAHARRALDAPAAGPGHRRAAGRRGEVLRRRAAAADGAGGRRLLPRALDARGRLHRRRRGRDGPRPGSATTRCSRPPPPTPTC